MSSSKPTSELNWKIKRDPYYSGLFESFGEDKILEAGFIYDSDTVDRDVTSSVDILCTPIHKIVCNLDKKNSEHHRGPCVLVSTGSFCPIHEGHALIMGQARATIEKAGYNVVGGFISPSHDEYIRAKTGPEWIPIHYRLRMIQQLLKKSDWLMIDPWEGVFNKVAINFTDVVIRTEAYLKKHIGIDIPVFFVCGGDNAKFALTFLAHGRCVVVNRPGYEDRFEKYKSILQSGLIASPNVDERIFWSYGGNALSSTGVRKERPFVPDEVKNLILRVEEYSELEPVIIDKLSAKFGSTSQKRLSEQREQFKDIESLPIISLDSLIKDTGNKLEISRLYDVFGAELIDYINRPGTPPLAEQVAAIEKKSYYIFDDDIHTGGTMRFAKGLLREHVNVKGVFSFSISSADEGEILDCRDFIINDNSNSGLVIQLPNKQQVRAPYIYPYVCPFHRGSIDSPLEFSIDVWRMNAEHYKDSEATLSDFPNWMPLFAYIGFEPTEKMFRICQWHAENLTNFVAT